MDWRVERENPGKIKLNIVAESREDMVMFSAENSIDAENKRGL